jgi:glutathione S-transferase
MTPGLPIPSRRASHCHEQDRGTVGAVKLYTTAKSANGRKPLALVHLLGLADRVEIVEVDVYAGVGRAPAYLAINPAGTVPTLVDDALVLPESNAILTYLAEQHGGARPTPARRAEILAWMFWEASAWQPALAAVLRDTVAHRLGIAATRPRRAPRWADAARVLDRLERHLTARPFVIDDLTIADVSIAGMMTYARAGAFPFDRYPHIASWYSVIEELPAWKATAVAPW